MFSWPTDASELSDDQIIRSPNIVFVVSANPKILFYLLYSIFNNFFLVLWLKCIPEEHLSEKGFLKLDDWVLQLLPL